MKYLGHLSQGIDKCPKDRKNRFPAIFHVETDAQWKLAFWPQLPKSKLPIAKAWSIFPGQFFHLFPSRKQQCLRVMVIALPTVDLYFRSIPMADAFTPPHSQSGFLETQKIPILTASNQPGMAFLLLPPKTAYMEIRKMTLWQHQLAEPAQRGPLHVIVYRKAASGSPKHRNPWVNMTLSF